MIAFVVVCVVHVLAILGSYDTIEWLTKPLLMPLLAAYVSRYLADNRRLMWVVAALLCSAAGDTVLLFSGAYPEQFVYFIGGLLLFLLAHILYIVYFVKWFDRKVRIWPLTAILIYLIAFDIMLFPHLDGVMKPAVLFYSLVIAAMGCSVIQLRSSVDLHYKSWIVLGALLFILSDSILAVTRFGVFEWGDPYSSLAIMTTYLSGQFFIAIGVVANRL